MLVYRFDVCAMMAHFRRVHTNSSAMTYALPPRTTVCGLIANMLGLKRDSYYHLFRRDNVYISIACLEPFYKLVQKINYIDAEKSQEITGSKGNPAQIRVEFLLPQNKTLRYRVWICLKNFPSDLSFIFHKICDEGKNVTYGSPLSLGPAFCSAWLENLRVGELVETVSGKAEIHSTIPYNVLKGVFLQSCNKIFNDEMPLEMKPDRTLSCALVSYIYDIGGVPVLCEVESYDRLKFGEEVDNVVWF